jgi:adenylate cyclase
VLDHGGTVMTYIGDEVFAIFGAPVPSEDHTSAAIGCARDLQERVGELDAALALHEFDPLRFGIGLNAGAVIVTHAGSTWRRQYTAIGDPVNVASRLCSQAGPGQIVLSESVRAAADPPPEVRPLGAVAMKGVRADFQAWTLVLEHPPSGTRDR